MRFIANLADADDTRLVNFMGQSGHAASAHYEDQFEAWRAVETRRLAFSPAAVAREGAQHAGSCARNRGHQSYFALTTCLSSSIVPMRPWAGTIWSTCTRGPGSSPRTAACSRPRA